MQGAAKAKQIIYKTVRTEPLQVQATSKTTDTHKERQTEAKRDKQTNKQTKALESHQRAYRKQIEIGPEECCLASKSLHHYNNINGQHGGMEQSYLE